MKNAQSSGLSEPQRQALQWLNRLRDSECNDQVKQDFSQWLALAPEHAIAYSEAQLFWEQIGGLPDRAGERLDAARAYLGKAGAARRRRNATLIFGVMALGILIGRPEYCQRLAADHYRTAKGEHAKIQLADGGGIELNTDSELRVSELFGARRVWLERGEAWFNVRHNPEQVFEVIVGKGRIRDVGTQFNVMADQTGTTVAVEEGEVAILTPDRPAVSVVAGQQSGFDENGAIAALSPVDSKAVGAWRDGVLVFKQQSLPEVLRQLSRYHQVDFELLDSKLQNLSVSGRFSTQDLNENLNTLSNGLGVKITRLTPERISLRAAK